APAARSRAYPNATFNFDDVALAASAFGQGSLLISPLTMTVVASTIADDGKLREPHVGLALTPYKAKLAASTTQPLVHDTFQQIMQPATAQNVRRAMSAVSQIGTASYGNAQDPIFGGKVNTSPTHMGGKTGTAQVGEGQRPTAWWISMAPDDQSPGAPGPAQFVIVVSKESGAGSGDNDGACQVYVADDIYRTLLHV